MKIPCSKRHLFFGWGLPASHAALSNSQLQNQSAKEKDENYRQFSDTYCTLQEKWEKDETDLWSLWLWFWSCLLFYVAVQYTCNPQLLKKMILCSWFFFYQHWRGVFCFVCLSVLFVVFFWKQTFVLSLGVIDQDNQKIFKQTWRNKEDKH